MPDRRNRRDRRLDRGRIVVVVIIRRADGRGIGDRTGARAGGRGRGTDDDSDRRRRVCGQGRRAAARSPHPSALRRRSPSQMSRPPAACRQRPPWDRSTGRCSWPDRVGQVAAHADRVGRARHRDRRSLAGCTGTELITVLGSGSNWSPVTLAMSTSGEFVTAASVGTTVIVKLTEPLNATSPKLAVTWPFATVAVTPATDVLAVTL